jgi:hypothetical protein
MTAVSIRAHACGASAVRPLMLSATPAGFPCPAEDHMDRELDVDRAEEARDGRFVVEVVEGTRTGIRTTPPAPAISHPTG